MCAHICSNTNPPIQVDPPAFVSIITEGVPPRLLFSRCERVVAARAAAANCQRSSRRGSFRTTGRRIPLVHPAGVPATLAGERAQAAPIARDPVAVHQPAVATEPGLPGHDVAGRPEPGRVVLEPRQRQRPHPERPRPPQAPAEPRRRAEHTPEPELQARQGRGLGILRRRDQETERRGAESQGGGGAAQGGQLTVRLLVDIFVNMEDSPTRGRSSCSSVTTRTRSSFLCNVALADHVDHLEADDGRRGSYGFFPRKVPDAGGR